MLNRKVTPGATQKAVSWVLYPRRDQLPAAGVLALLDRFLPLPPASFPRSSSLPTPPPVFAVHAHLP